MKVVVTGAAGFIGSHIVDMLCGQGAKVICIDSLDPGIHHGAPNYLNRSADYCFADLRYWAPDSRFDDVEAVVHLAALGGVSRAAKEPRNVIEANAGGSARIIEASRGWTKLRRFILASSFSIYGSNYRYVCDACKTERNGARRTEDLNSGIFEVVCGTCGGECSVLPITEETEPNPLETYAASKYMQELALRGQSHCAISILRFSSVYGPRLRLDDGEATIIARLAGWIRSGVKPKLFEDGKQKRDWVYVDDVVGCVQAILLHGPTYPCINVCSGRGTSLLEACTILQTVIGVTQTPEIVGGFRAGDMRHCLGNPSRMRELLGRSPTAFTQGAAFSFRSINEAEPCVA